MLLEKEKIIQGYSTIVNIHNLDYEMITIREKINDSQAETKELDAEKAKLLAVDRLRGLAKKYELHTPQQEQIIVIP